MKNLDQMYNRKYLISSFIKQLDNAHHGKKSLQDLVNLIKKEISE